MKGLATVLRHPVELIPGAFALVAYVWLALADGGVLEVSWYPAALLALGLALTGAFLVRRLDLGAPPAPVIVSIAFFVAFTVWSYLGIAWAENPGGALTAANRSLMYLCAFGAFAILPWRARIIALVLGAYATALAITGLWILAETASSNAPEEALVAGRFSEPLGYHNGVAALYLMAALPALYLASLRRIPALARGLLLAASGVLVQLALIPQSRGSAIALGLMVVLYVAIVPDRVRAISAALVVGVAVLLASPPLLDVYETFTDGGDLAAAFDDALRAIAISAGALFVLGLAVGLADRRLEIAAPVARRLRVGGGVALAVVALGAVGVAISATGDPFEWVDERWEEFREGEGGGDEETSRFASGLGSQRYDFWRVALDEFRETPLAGQGGESFAAAYVRDRRTDQEPLYPHSLELRILSQTGVVGAGLFAGFLIAAFVAFGRVRLGADRFAARCASAAALPAVYWLVHGSGDWFWEVPALALPALSWLAVSGRAVRRVEGSRLDEEQATEPARRRGRVAIGALGFASVAAAVVLLACWAAARDTDLAGERWGGDPETAFDRIDRALDLNPLDERPAVIGGAIASRLGEIERMRSYFGEAVERNPQNWYAQLELGAAEAVGGRRRVAAARLAEADRLNPREPVIDEVLRRVRERRPVSLDAIDRVFLERTCERFSRTAATSHCPKT